VPAATASNAATLAAPAASALLAQSHCPGSYLFGFNTITTVPPTSVIWTPRLELQRSCPFERADLFRRFVFARALNGDKFVRSNGPALRLRTNKK
jgi:hypothetical protein